MDRRVVVVVRKMRQVQASPYDHDSVHVMEENLAWWMCIWCVEKMTGKEMRLHRRLLIEMMRKMKRMVVEMRRLMLLWKVVMW